MFSRRISWDLAPNALARALEAHRRAGRTWLDLTASNPTHVGLRYDEQTIVGALADPAALVYRPEPKGLLSARAAVAAYYQELAGEGRPADDDQRSSGQSVCPEAPDFGLAKPAPSVAAKLRPATHNRQLSSDSIVLTVSTSEAYSFVFRLLCDPGEEVLVPRPSYPLFDFLAGLEGVRLAPYSLFYDHGWHIDFHSLESALTPRSRAIILVHPNNPTGSYVSAREAEQLNLLCRRHALALVADEVFLDYALCGTHASFAFNWDALTFTLSGISKISGLPQMKLAWIVVSGPEELAAPALSRLELIADTYLSMNAPVQLAAPALLAQRHTIHRQLVTRVRSNLTELDRQLAARPLCSRLEVEGGWYVVMRVPATRSDEELAVTLLDERDVLVQPGYFYDFPGDGYLVLSLITPEEEFREGVARVLDFVR